MTEWVAIRCSPAFLAGLCKCSYQALQLLQRVETQLPTGRRSIAHVYELNWTELDLLSSTRFNCRHALIRPNALFSCKRASITLPTYPIQIYVVFCSSLGPIGWRFTKQTNNKISNLMNFGLFLNANTRSHLSNKQPVYWKMYLIPRWNVDCCRRRGKLLVFINTPTFHDCNNLAETEVGWFVDATGAAAAAKIMPW